MLLEKETTGIYISGHPMDDYREYLKNTKVVPIGQLMEEESNFQDDQIISVAGVVQSVKNKTTRNNSMMSYVTIEDDTAAIEMLAFSNVIAQYGGYLRENAAIVVTGRLSTRENKEPQIVINRARPISDYSSEQKIKDLHPQIRKRDTIYLRLPSEADPRFGKVKAILNMFPGEAPAVIFFADTKMRRGTKCQIADSMVEELERVLGKDNVVLK